MESYIHHSLTSPYIYSVEVPTNTHIQAYTHAQVYTYYTLIPTTSDCIKGMHVCTIILQYIQVSYTCDSTILIR